MKNNNTNKKNNNFFIPKSIVLVNNTGKKISITEKSNTKKVLKKIIEGYNKVASIKCRNGEEKNLRRIERSSTTHLPLDLDLQISIGHPISVERRDRSIGSDMMTRSLTNLLQLKWCLHHANLTKECRRIM